jgi:hypothetical protein
MVRYGSIVWLLISLGASIYAGNAAYVEPQRFAVIVGLLATIISILIGVYLAVIAVLTSPFSVSQYAVTDKDEAMRVSKLANKEDAQLASGQLIFFWLFFGALALSLLFVWKTAGDTTEYNDQHVKTLACGAASVGVFAFMWSARLPLILQRISIKRRTLG